MNQDPIICSVEAGLGRLHFNMPKSLNALSVPMALAFRSAVKTLVENPDVRIILLSAEGRSFMAGGDLNYFHTATDKSDAAATLITPVNEALKALHKTDKIIVSALQGPVAGAGIGIALSADIVIAAEDVSFTTAYIRLGATMDCGGSAALVRRLGYAKAIELALLSEPVASAEALRLGLVNRLIPREQLDEAANSLVSRLLKGPGVALTTTKALLKGAPDRSYPEQLQAELRGFSNCAVTSDFREGVAAFLEKRKPTFEPPVGA